MPIFGNWAWLYVCLSVCLPVGLQECGIDPIRQCLHIESHKIMNEYKWFTTVTTKRPHRFSRNFVAKAERRECQKRTNRGDVSTSGSWMVDKLSGPALTGRRGPRLTMRPPAICNRFRFWIGRGGAPKTTPIIHLPPRPLAIRRSLLHVDTRHEEWGVRNARTHWEAGARETRRFIFFFARGLCGHLDYFFATVYNGARQTDLY